MQGLEASATAYCLAMPCVAKGHMSVRHLGLRHAPQRCCARTSSPAAQTWETQHKTHMNYPASCYMLRWSPRVLLKPLDSFPMLHVLAISRVLFLVCRPYTLAAMPMRVCETLEGCLREATQQAPARSAYAIDFPTNNATQCPCGAKSFPRTLSEYIWSQEK